MSIVDPYIKAKQKSPKFRAYQEGLITDKDIQREEKALRPAPAAPAPSGTGVYCRICKRELQHYDVHRGECFRHPLDRIRAAREAVARVGVSDPRDLERARRSVARRKAS